MFDLNAYLACVDEGLDCFEVSLGEHDPFEAPMNVVKGNYYLRCDLGYVRDPSEFVVYRSTPPDLVNVTRVNLHGVNYHRRQRIIEELDRAYGFRAIWTPKNSRPALPHFSSRRFRRSVGTMSGADGPWQEYTGEQVVASRLPRRARFCTKIHNIEARPAWKPGDRTFAKRC